MRKLPAIGLAMFLALAACAGAWAAGAAAPGADAISISGAVSKAQTWTAEQLKSDFAKDAKTVSYAAKDGSKHAATAVPLMDLVKAGGPALDSKIKNDELRLVVVVVGKDGYIATFALAELMPAIGGRDAFVAVDVDGKALSDRDSPAELIVTGDQKPERWVHGIKMIRIIDAGEGPG